MKLIKNILAKFDNTPKIEDIPIKEEVKKINNNFNTFDTSFLYEDDDFMFGVKDCDHKKECIDHFDNIMKQQYNNIKSIFKSNTKTFDNMEDFNNASCFPYSYDNGVMQDLLIKNSIFRGFAYYSYFAMVPMVNNSINAYTKDILREGFKFISKDVKNDHKELIYMLTKEWEKFECDIILRQTIEKTLALGGANIYPKLKNDDKILEKELKVKDKTTIGENDLLSFHVIEPTWMFPLNFNATNPLQSDFYKPQLYSAMGNTIHVSRFIKMVFWELPDLIKPVFYFYGLSLTGKMLQSLQNFEIIQTEVPSMIKRMNFGILNVPLPEGTNGKANLIKRIKNFIYNVSNFGMFVVNKENESFEQITRNISGLDDLVARFAELLSTTIQMPVTKLLGVSPKGFSTNDETGHRNWYDLITGIRTTNVQPGIMQMANYLCLNKGIELPDTISIEWGNLEAINEHDAAKTKEFTAKSDILYVTNGIVESAEVRQKLATTPDSGYNNINPNKKVKMPENSQENANKKQKISLSDKE